MTKPIAKFRSLDRSALHLSVSSLAVAILATAVATPSMAQVAPTEVNEEAVDEFGLERKTGRFTWSTGEIIGIGGEESRISIAATGVRSPAHATTILPSVGRVLEINQPRLSIASKPDETTIFPGAIDPNRSYVTVDYSGGSHTFECTASECFSKYLEHSGLVPLGLNEYIFTNAQGVTIEFDNDQSTTTYPDGRQITVSATGFRRNNFGFMLRRQVGGQPGEIFAVNLSEDYCSDDTQTACTGLTAARSARLPTAYVTPLEIVDADGGVTKLRWESKIAKSYTPPQGDAQAIAQQFPFNLDLTSRYPLGITLPGSTAEDITIAYEPHVPAEATHDDIRVASITKNGVTVDYNVYAYYPFGKRIEVQPTSDPAGGTLLEFVTYGSDGVVADPHPNNPHGDNTCTNILPPILSIDGDTAGATLFVCSYHTGGQAISAGSGISIPPDRTTVSLPPGDDGDPTSGIAGGNFGKEIYDLTITATIDGELVSKSKSKRPYSDFGMARRRLTYVEDGLERRTRYFHNHLEEVAIVIQPDGNSVSHGIDARGNIISSVLSPKSDSTEDSLVTTLTYSADCVSTPLPRCNKPLTITDPKGNVTEYTYNDRGQVLTETQPAPSDTAGAARPTTVNEYTMRQAYIKNANGSPMVAGPQISLLTKSFTCISEAVCDANTPAIDKVVTEYNYGPTTGLNNLLLRGMTVTAVNGSGQLETLRTCYTYNYFGERIAETQPKAGLTACP